MRALFVAAESWPIAGAFRIARGSKSEAQVIVASIADGAARGRGECVPYARYGESMDSVQAQIESVRGEIERGLSREALHRALPAGAARNALDCALWDLEAKRARKPVHELAGLPPPKPVATAFTLGIDTPARMGEAARTAGVRPILKLKLAGDADDLARVAAVREAVPQSKLIVDANEAFTRESLAALAPQLARLGVALIEQPLPANADEPLESFASPVPLCADESAHDRDTLGAVAGRYAYINIKLDKTGGFTEAIALARAAHARGLKLMVGCMVATSLAMAPAVLLAQDADWVDLDGPLLLSRDRDPGLRYDGALVYPPEAVLWG